MFSSKGQEGAHHAGFKVATESNCKKRKGRDERSSDVWDWGGRHTGSYLNGLCISLFIWSMFNRAGW